MPKRIKTCKFSKFKVRNLAHKGEKTWTTLLISQIIIRSMSEC